MKQRIKSVTSINSLGTKSFTVGEGGVAEIIDRSVEFKDSIFIKFDAYDDIGNLIGVFINGAFSIEYFKEEE